MPNVKQHLIEEVSRNITNKEREVQESDLELSILGAKVKVENKILSMQDTPEDIKNYFIYTAQALKDMLAQEQNRNSELKKDLQMLKYQEAFIESQFSDSELDG
ncbi:MAG: hypothetical protein Q8P11_02560 [bacterium]|nr:hypothetical protein [bacterium]